MAYDIRTRNSGATYFVEWRTDVGDPWTVGAAFNVQAAADDAALYFVPPGQAQTNPPPIRYEDRIFLSASNMMIEPVRSGTVMFSNANGFTFGIDTNSAITGSYNAGAQSDQTQNIIRAFGAGAATQTSGTVIFSNSNGLSFGLNAGTVTGSYSVPSTAGLISGINISASNASANLSNFVLSAANGLSFGLNGSTITGSYTVPTQTVQTSNIVVPSAGTQTASSGTVVFSNSNGISFGMSGSSRITASHNGLTSQSNQAVSGANGSFTFQTLSLADSNGISWSTGTQGLFGTVKTDYLTTQTNQRITAFAASNTTQGTSGTYNASSIMYAGAGNVSVGISNGSIVISGAGAAGGGVAIADSAGTQTSGTVQFSNASGVSFGLNGGTLTASVKTDYLTTAMQSNAATISNIKISAGTSSANLSALTFSDLNGISFGLNGSVLTGSIATALTSQSNQNITAANGGFAFQTLSFSNLNGISFGTSAGSAITASHNALTSQSNQAVSGANGSFTFQTLTLANSNGVSFSTGTQGVFATVKTDYLTTQTVQPGLAALSVDGLSLFTSGTANLTTQSDGHIEWHITNGAIAPYLRDAPIQWNLSGNTVGLDQLDQLNSLTFQGGNNITLSGITNGKIVISGLSFANSNGITFGTNAGTLTASHNGLTTQTNPAVSAGNGSFSFQTLSLVNSNNISFSTGTGGIRASYSPVYDFQIYGNTAGSTQFYSAGAIILEAGANVTFSQNADSILINAGGGAGVALAAGTQTATSGTIAFANSNGLTFGMSGSSQITASHNAMTGFGISAGTAASTLSRITLFDAGNMSFGMNAGSILTANAYPGVTLRTTAGGGETQGTSTMALSGFNITAGQDIFLFGSTDGIFIGANANGIVRKIFAGTAMQEDGGVSFANSNGIVFGMDEALDPMVLTASYQGVVDSYYPSPLPFMQSTGITAPRQQSQIIFPIDVNANISFGRIQIPISVSALSTSLGTTANTSGSFGVSETNRYAIYIKSVLNPNNLTSLTSFSNSNAMSIAFTAGTAGSQYTVSQGGTYFNSVGSSSTWSTSYALSNASIQISSTQHSGSTGIKFRNVGVSTSLSEGEYWFMMNVSSTTGNNNAVLSNGRTAHSFVVLPLVNNAVGYEGVVNNASFQIRPGIGLITAVAPPLASFSYSIISSQASHNIPYVTFISV